LSDPTKTKPDRWSVSTTYFDSKGQYVNRKLIHGGSVLDNTYSFGKNLSTAFQFPNPDGVNPTGTADQSDVCKILKSYIGQGKPFPYNPNGVYFLLTAPEVTRQEYDEHFYVGYHGSFNTTGIVDSNGIEREVTINHAYVTSIGAVENEDNLETSSFPNGDTGYQTVDRLLNTVHHELMEAVSDPVPGYGWYGETWGGGDNENVDVCENANFFYNMRYTGPNNSGQWYNTIINGQRYILPDAWTFDMGGAQGCYSEVPKSVRSLEFKPRSLSQNILTASEGDRKYNGDIYIPCRAFYIDRFYAGYTDSHTDGCTIFYKGYDLAYEVDQPGSPLFIPKNYQVLSKNHGHYKWRKMDESKAFKEYPGDVASPHNQDGGDVFVVHQDNWFWEEQADGQLKPANSGDYFFCRAKVNGVWRVGETFRGHESCDVIVEGQLVQVSKTDESVAYLVRPAKK
jgi:hypothetical protein